MFLRNTLLFVGAVSALAVAQDDSEVLEIRGDLLRVHTHTATVYICGTDTITVQPTHTASVVPTNPINSISIATQATTFASGSSKDITGSATGGSSAVASATGSENGSSIATASASSSSLCTVRTGTQPSTSGSATSAANSSPITTIPSQGVTSTTATSLTLSSVTSAASGTVVISTWSNLTVTSIPATTSSATNIATVSSTLSLLSSLSTSSSSFTSSVATTSSLISNSSSTSPSLASTLSTSNLTNSTVSTSSSSLTSSLSTSTLSTSTLSTSTSSTSTCPSATANAFVNQTTCNGKTYTYQQLAGYGLIPSNATDMFGDTIGGIGSAIALDRTQWTKLANGSYSGVLWALPDRGWNTQGTLNFQPRVHKFNILFTPQPCATVANPSASNLKFQYDSSILFYGPDGVTPTTGLDADGSGHYSYPGFPDLPISTYSGDGFGGAGSVHQRIPLDTEGIVLMNDGTFWISDEYGPYVYHFDVQGKMIQAIRPNDAIIPMRNGTESFSADSPFEYINGGSGDDVSPADNPTGRDNNHGFEGLTISGDGNSLYFLLQAAANQEGGLSKQTERYTRFLKYDISQTIPQYIGEWVVPLPLYVDPTAKASKNPKVAAQSEIFHITGEQFFVLSRDSGAGHGQTVSTSVYRQADVFDISGATNIAGPTFDCTTCAIASSAGVLNSAITPAAYCSFLDFNVNSQLNRFGVHNGGPQDQALLNEKWESIGLVPVDGQNGADGEYFLFSLSDNDFITQDGHLNFGQFAYKDASGFNLDSQALVFQISLPAGVNPFSGA